MSLRRSFPIFAFCLSAIFFFLPRGTRARSSAESSPLDRETFETLCSEIVESAENGDDLRAAAEEGRSADEFAARSAGKEVFLELGGLQWTAVYLSMSEKEDVVLTLWLADSEERELWSLSDPRSDRPENEIPGNLYGRSYLRAVLCGSPYLADDRGSVSEGADVQNDTWKKFLENYGKFLLSPEEIPYQNTQSARDLLGETYDLPNESLGTEQELSYDYRGKAGYFDWKTDKLWLPSLSEVGNEPETGLWKTSFSQRGTDETKSVWLRTGAFFEDHGEITPRAYYLHGDESTADSIEGNTSLLVRPAIHLDLSRIAPETQPLQLEKPAKTSAEKIYDGSPLALTVENADMLNVSEPPAGAEYVLSEDKKKGTFSATNAGSYRLEISPKENAVWTDGTREPVALLLTIGRVRKVLTAVWELLPETDGEREPFRFETQTSDSAESVYNGRDLQEIPLSCFNVSLLDENGEPQRAVTLSKSATGGGSLPGSRLEVRLSLPDEGGNVQWELVESSARFTLEVVPRPVSVKLRAGSGSVYGEPLPLPSSLMEYEADSLRLLEGDETALLFSGLSDRPAAGTHFVSFALQKEYSDRYLLFSERGTFTVSPKTGAAEGLFVPKKEYDGSALATVSEGARFSGALEGDEATLSAAARFEDGNAGRDKPVRIALSLTGADAKNYRLEQEELVVVSSILPRALRMEIQDTQAIYGDPLPQFECNLIGGTAVPGDDLRLRLFLSGPAETAGEYEIFGECLNPNYSVTFEGGIFTILKAKIEIPTVSNLIYNGKVQTAGLDENLFIVDDKGGKNVGTYTAKLQLKDPTNYEFATGETEIELSYQILPYEITVQIEDASSVYGEEFAELKYIVLDKIFDGDELEIFLSFDGKNAGEYEISGNWTNQNYAVTFEGGTYTILKAKVAVPTVSNLIYNGKIQTAGLDEELFIVDDMGGKDVGTYTAKLRLKDPTNYEFATGADEITLQYKILPYEITVQIEDASSVYGETFAELKYTVLGEIFDGDELGITLTFDGENAGEYEIKGTWDNKNYAVTFENGIYTILKSKVAVPTGSDLIYNGKIQTSGLDESLFLVDDKGGKNVGTYQAKLKLKDPENYEFATGADEITLEYQILPYGITVQIENASSVYGEKFAELKYTVLDEIFDGDELEIALSFDGENAGEYEITGTWDNKNYAVTFKGGTYTILKAQVSVPTISNLIYNGKIQTARIDENLFIVNDKGGKNVGTYTAKLQLNDPTNYEFAMGETKIELTYQILPYKIAVQIEDASSVYGENFAELKYTVLGEIFDSDELGITLSFDGKNAGKYEIQGNWDNKNYNVTFKNGTYTILKAKVAVPIVSDLIYNGKVQTAELDENLFIVNDDGGKNVGTYQAKLSLKDPTNYEFATGADEITLEYQILPYEITVQIEDASSVYGEAYAELNYTVLGEIFDGDELGITLSFDGENAGEYEIKGSWNNKNYAVTFKGGTYTILKAKNEWLGEFPNFEEGEIPDLAALPKAKFGETEVAFFLDPACTQEYSGDLNMAQSGTYYLRVRILPSENFEGIEAVFTFEIGKTPKNGFPHLELLCGAGALAGCLAAVYALRKRRTTDRNSRIK